MKLSNLQIGGLRQYIYTLKFSEQELIERVCEYLSSSPEHLYHGDIVVNDKRSKLRPHGYITTDGKLFCQVIADYTIENGLNISPDETCLYSKGCRDDIRHTLNYLKADPAGIIKYCNATERHEERLCKCLYVCGAGDFEVLDYQVPTRNSGHDKIDLILRKGETTYITEVKFFGSDESLLRCVLEIETYYKKLNENFYGKYNCSKNSLKKAILIDKTSFAYSQTGCDWAKRLTKKFDIDILIISMVDGAFTIDFKTKK